VQHQRRAWYVPLLSGSVLQKVAAQYCLDLQPRQQNFAASV
jgi:hypothetical protein